MLFLLPPETAHDAAIASLKHPWWLRAYVPPKALATRVWGLQFASPIGLAAGFDKSAEVMHATQKMGFGFAEIGTLTPKPQAGNPRPRMFRLSAHEAIINRLGFNNQGVEVARSRLMQRPAGWMIGGNIGKNKDSADAVQDYKTAMAEIYALVDYITVNISSPNTPGLRNLQEAAAVSALLGALQTQRSDMVRMGLAHKPILVKLAPDMHVADAEATIAALVSSGVDGLIISNTTLSRGEVGYHPRAKEAGGLSGRPLMNLATEMLRTTYRQTSGRIPLIGVGGVSSAADAYAKILAGASLVQLYSALIYQGPGLIARMHDELLTLLQRDGFAHVSDAVGKAA